MAEMEAQTSSAKTKYLILLSIAAIFAFSTFYSLRSVNKLLDSDASHTVEQWADAFVVQADLMETVLSRRPLTAEQRQTLEIVAKEGSVFRFNLYDAQGNLRLVSDVEGLPENGENLFEHEPELAARLLQGERITQLQDGRDKLDRPDFYAETFVPIMRDGEVRGLVEIYVDQTERRQIFAETLYPNLGLTLALCIIALMHTLYTARLLKKEKNASDRAFHLAHHDGLTGIANREVFHQRLADRLEGKRQADGKTAIHMIDLDGFKTVNDRYGHGVGDELLRTVTDALLQSMRRNDLLARLGGDEFAVIQSDVDDENMALRLADRMVEAAREIKRVGNVSVHVTASVGTYMLATMSDGETPDLVLSRADAALYHAKAQGKDQAALFEPAMEKLVRSRQKLRDRLISAVRDNTIEVFYQPQHDANTGTLCGFEALARLPDGDGDYISPDQFIPVAEELRLMPKMGACILERACRTAATWPDDLQLAVNLSVQQFEKDLVETVRTALSRSGLRADRLELEITESMFIHDHDVASVERQLHELKRLGIQIAMDDFGTGYSSLSSLWRFPFDKLKVDRSVVSQLDQSETVNFVLETIATLGHTMRLRVTAEGVENEAQRASAELAGCNEIQGYFYAKPMSSDMVDGHILKSVSNLLSDKRPAETAAAESQVARKAAG
ncbi:bifunctional diguanylate cyclase/phosphodiesterase [Notoacmeibacter sp. MSK16QG-6]|uniref:putative bifunctional diguanylate cyclase/phosphodiesterase n=1 Tax=Notoacmeibacter sp. MSK16QG-6 TaxID=2957982 RepID=UPI00209CBF5F|nr:EAL domain-containing protein [Notoacmeibacter sp. MSK16QG-6]MCP1199933.1 EAL domain-containing protein [Notoacmeibacter sp. MSK16QG-6]